MLIFAKLRERHLGNCERESERESESESESERRQLPKMVVLSEVKCRDGGGVGDAAGNIIRTGNGGRFAHLN